MMELKIEADIFYVLDAGNEKRLYNSEKDAIESLKAIVAENADLNPENVNIIEVNIKEEQWEMKTVPWSKIAMGLIRGE